MPRRKREFDIGWIGGTTSATASARRRICTLYAHNKRCARSLMREYTQSGQNRQTTKNPYPTRPTQRNTTKNEHKTPGRQRSPKFARRRRRRFARNYVTGRLCTNGGGGGCCVFKMQRMRASCACVYGVVLCIQVECMPGSSIESHNVRSRSWSKVK